VNDDKPLIGEDTANALDQHLTDAVAEASAAKRTLITCGNCGATEGFNLGASICFACRKPYDSRLPVPEGEG